MATSESSFGKEEIFENKIMFKFKRVTLPGESHGPVPSDLEMSASLLLHMESDDVVFIAFTSFEVGLIPELKMHVLWLSQSHLPGMIYGLLDTKSGPVRLAVLFLQLHASGIESTTLVFLGLGTCSLAAVVSLRILFKNMLGLIPNDFATHAFGGELPTSPKIATKKFVLDKNNTKSKICLSADLTLAACDPPYARKFRSEKLANLFAVMHF